MRLRFLTALAAGLLSAATVSADVKLPHLFSEHMVLQQQAAANIWGWADKDEEVTVTLGDAKATAKGDENGKFKAVLKTPAAGGPFELKVAGKNTITIGDVYVGEVWLASGQSNMEWRVKQCANPQEEAANAKYPLIREFFVPHVTADKPADDVNAKWTVCSPETAPNFSAVAYYFAREIHKELNVPVGIINSSWGGTICEAWASRPALEAVADFKPILDRGKEYKAGNPNQACNLYNAMIAPLVPYTFKGALWYQGESNRDRALQYRTLFPAMITDWRKQFGQGDFPFLFVQLAPYTYVRDKNPALDAQREKLPEIWESQTATLSLANTGMAVTTDITEIGDIPPKNKQDVGKRLSLWALAKTYGKDRPYSGPLYKSSAVENNAIRIKFDHAEGLNAKSDQPLTHFTICGEDKKWVPAKAKIDGNTVVVSADDVAKPVAVRFAWTETAEPNLFNKAGLPASPFRTDDFPLVTKDAK